MDRDVHSKLFGCLLALSIEVEVKCILLLPSAHILLLWRRPECVHLRLLLVWLLLLSLRSSKGVERVLAHRSRHTWLVGVHAHGHTSTHSHASAHSTCRGVHAAHTLHCTRHYTRHCSRHLTRHRSRHLSTHAHACTSHWSSGTEGIRLETRLGWRLLHCTEGISLGLLSRIGSAHELGERVRAGQLLLRLELIGLGWLAACIRRLVIIVVEALEHAQLVGVGQGGERLVPLRENVVEGVRCRLACVAATLGRIRRKHIEKVVGHVCVRVCGGCSISGLCVALSRSVRSEVKEVVGCLCLVVGGGWLIGSLAVIHKLTKSESRLLGLLSCRLDLLRSGSCCLSWLCCDSCKIARIDHLKKTEILIHLELLGWVVIDHLGRSRHSVILIDSVQGIAVEIHVLNVLQIFFSLVFLILDTLTHATCVLGDAISVLLVAHRLVIGLGYDDSQSVNQASLWIVEIWQRDWEIKDVDKLVSLIFDGLCEVHEVLVHDKCLLSVSFAEAWESFEELRDVRVVDPVDLHEIFEQHENDIGKKARLLAEIRVLEHLKDLRGEPLKVLVVL